MITFHSSILAKSTKQSLEKIDKIIYTIWLMIGDFPNQVALRLGELQPKNVIELNDLEMLLKAVLEKKEIPHVGSKDLRDRVIELNDFCKEGPLFEEATVSQIAKKIDQIFFQVCFPRFFTEFTTERIEKAFEQYEEMFEFSLDHMDVIPIRSRHTIESVLLLLKRACIHCLDDPLQILCSSHLPQLLFFSMHQAPITVILQIADIETKTTCIAHAAGLVRLASHGLPLSSLLKLRKPSRLETIADWKQVCFNRSLKNWGQVGH